MHRPSQPQACSPLPRWRLQNSQEQVSGLRGSASLTSVPGTALGRGSGSMPLPWTPRPGPPHSLTQRFLSPSRPRVPEEKDSAECPGPATEPGRDHVQPTRVPGDSQVSCRGSRPPPPSSVSHAGGRAPGPLQTPPGHRAQPCSPLHGRAPRGHPRRERRLRHLRSGSVCCLLEHQISFSK